MYIHIQAYTYTYIQYMQIHTDMCTYVLAIEIQTFLQIHARYMQIHAYTCTYEPIQIPPDHTYTI